MEKFKITIEEFAKFWEFLGRDKNELSEMLKALREFKQKNPWSGDFSERKQKFTELHEKFNKIFKRRVKLEIKIPENPAEWGPSGNSSYNILHDTITLRGRFSVITFLHEWMHAIFGFSEQVATKLSQYIFSIVFPEKWQKLEYKNGLLVPKTSENSDCRKKRYVVKGANGVDWVIEFSEKDIETITKRSIKRILEEWR